MISIIKKVLKDCFTVMDEPRYSYTRIFIVFPLTPVFMYKVIESSAPIDQIAKAIAWVIIALSVATFFSRLVKDGSVKSVIEAFKK